MKPSGVCTVLFLIASGVVLPTSAGCSKPHQEASIVLAVPAPVFSAPPAQLPPPSIAPVRTDRTARPTQSPSLSGLSPEDINYLKWLLSFDQQRRASDAQHSKEADRLTAPGSHATDAVLQNARTMGSQYAAAAQRIRSQVPPPECRMLGKAYGDYLEAVSKDTAVVLSIGSARPLPPPGEAYANTAGHELQWEVSNFKAQYPNSAVDISALGSP